MATRIVSKWLVLAVDLFIIAASFFLAYIIRFNLAINFDISKLVLQIPVVVLIALLAFLITGSYKGIFGYSYSRDAYNIFNAICLWSVLIISLIVINQKWGIYPNFSIPLSIIIITIPLSLVGLTASHYFIRTLYNALVKRNLG